MIPWQELDRREIAKVDLREKYIATQSVVIQALGRVGSYFWKHPECEMKVHLSKLEMVKWQRSAKVWLHRAILPNGRIITNKKAIMLIANALKQAMKIPLTNDEKQAENEYLKEVRS